MSEGEFSFFTAVAFTLNYIIGTGFLTLPWAFEKVGLIPSVLLLVLLTIFACASAVYILETMARATTMRHLGMCSQSHSRTHSIADVELDELQGIVSNSLPVQSNYGSTANGQTTEPALFRPFDHNEAGEVNDNMYLRSYTVFHHENCNSRMVTWASDDVNLGQKKTADVSSGDPTEYPLHRISGPKMEVTELCELYLGKMGKGVYTALVGIYLYGTLAAYSTVFANALSQRLSVFSPGEDKTTDYYVFLGLFTCLVTPLSCMELNEQVYIQIALSLCRVLMLALMIGSVVSADISCAGGAAEQDKCVSFGDYNPLASDLVDTNVFSLSFDKIYIILPLIGYANIFHHSIPSLAQPVLHKRSLHSIFIVALLICSGSYAVISCVLSLYFKDHIKSSANLNWLHYTGLHDVNKSGLGQLLVHYISYYVVLFPALDVASAFPLNAITLGNSIRAFFSERAMRRGADPAQTNSHTVFYRLLAVLPAIAVASCVKDLTVITSFTGLAGFSIAFIIPSLLALQSEQLMAERGVPCTDTQYNCVRIGEWEKRAPRANASLFDRLGSTVSLLLLKFSALLSNGFMKWTSIVFGVFLSIYVFYSLMSQGASS